VIVLSIKAPIFLLTASYYFVAKIDITPIKSEVTYCRPEFSLTGITMQRKDESDEEYTARQAAEAAELRRHAIVFWHAVFQALLAMGLLQLRPWKPRTVGALGIIASVMNCYMLYPSLPHPLFGGLFSSSKHASAPAAPPTGALAAAGEKFAKAL
jgi:hypothetical protein